MTQILTLIAAAVATLVGIGLFLSAMRELCDASLPFTRASVFWAAVGAGITWGGGTLLALHWPALLAPLY